MCENERRAEIAVEAAREATEVGSTVFFTKDIPG